MILTATAEIMASLYQSLQRFCFGSIFRTYLDLNTFFGFL